MMTGVSPLDVLIVIIRLNSPEGEGELPRQVLDLAAQLSALRTVLDSIHAERSVALDGDGRRLTRGEPINASALVDPMQSQLSTVSPDCDVEDEESAWDCQHIDAALEDLFGD